MPPDVMTDALRRLPRDELDEALRHKLFPLAVMPGLRMYAACGTQAVARAARLGRKLVAAATREEFHAAIRETHGGYLIREATLWLAARFPDKSARHRLTDAQALAGIGLAAFVVGLVLALPKLLLWSAASLVGGLFFLAVIALRVLCLLPRGALGTPRPVPVPDDLLPVYSVLVPAFRETAVLGQLLTALRRLDYPADKLDIKLILEENDASMREAIAAITLPGHFETIVVPAGKPQTKPRALNYALAFARGELLTIFDAEDIPEPRQLRQAAETFAASPPELACLQAELVFYNPNENWLARQFTIEYATLFGLLLPVLASHGLPLLLGGTSNHFRIDALRAVGAWDPFNVTEDADLGLRLVRAGYEAATIDSRTYEEANVRLGNWQRQRARWLKGFLATWLVHMRNPRRLWRELGASGFWVAQATTLGVYGSALLHPLCMALTVYLFFALPLPASESTSLKALAGLNLMVMATGYGATIIAGRRGLRHIGIAGWWLPLVTMPVYWLLTSAAAWLALWQFIAAPFHWNKTQHGLSNVQRKRRRTTVVKRNPPPAAA